MNRTALLLVNLGSPASPQKPDVRRYLREFLMDERVIDLPCWKRFLVVHGFILPFRVAKSAAAYQKIWRPEGAPLLAFSRRLQQRLQETLPLPVALAMRYQQPSLREIIRQLADQDIRKIVLMPLYPHYAMSSYESVVVRARELIAALTSKVELQVIPPFYAHPAYLQALAVSAQGFLSQGFDHLLFSFHGLPERHLCKSDPTGHHCLATPSCCQTDSPALPTCYRAQVLRTVTGFAKLTRLSATKYSVAFQSRLGRDPWLQPFTDREILRLAQTGIKRLAVICPAFVTDCLETLEEIGLRGRETFLEAGGREFTLIPCLNDHPKWASALAEIVQPYL
jgi:protoporphyrin/coproporphyrin ferrochelatase